MKRFVRLSYDIAVNMPLYPGTPDIKIEPMKSIPKGDSCNTYLVSMQNHAGTHVDFPNHFHAEGRRLSEFDINELVFNNPCIVDCPKSASSAIMPDDLRDKINKASDILFIRTGFYKIRDTEDYTHKNPFIHPDTARMLKYEYPCLRALVLDTISAANHKESQFGRETHRILLEERPILIIEDADLSGDLTGLKEVMAVPLYIDGVDSSQVTLIGVFDD